MGVDVRLLDLWMKAGPDEMYVLSPQEARGLRVSDDGRKAPNWSIVKTPRGSLLRGEQATPDGTGTVSWSCDDTQTILASAFEAAGKGESMPPGGWTHVLTIDRSEEHPLKVLSVSHEDGVLRGRFTLPPHVVRRAMSAKQLGHQMKASGSRSSSVGYSIDIDPRSASMVKTFLGDCLRRQAKSLLP